MPLEKAIKLDPQLVTLEVGPLRLMALQLLTDFGGSPLIKYGSNWEYFSPSAEICLCFILLHVLLANTPPIRYSLREMHG